MDKANQVDMSSEAIATRLKRVSQLRRLCLSLGKARIDDSTNGELPTLVSNDETTNELDQDRDS
jgi:hypothetical protein